MLHKEEETPSRLELLSMVKKHSNLLGWTVVGEEDASDVEMDQNFWNDIFNLYFIVGKESRERQDDDLLFFVRKLISNLLQGGISKRDRGESPYFVRRWASKLDALLGESSVEVDWRRSFYLNLIAHTKYSVTVAICSQQVLKSHRPGENTPLNPVYKVVKTVYASASRVNFHLDAKKEVETVPAYPDICFAVDDFDSTFDAVVLSDTDHCYCVLLNAHDGAAFPSKKLDQQETSSTPFTQVTIFSGFVSYQMVREAYDAGKSHLGSLLSSGNQSSKTDRIYMKGPGGRGEVEVAVSGVEDKTQENSGSPSTSDNLKKGFAAVVRKAASAAAKQLHNASGNADDEMLPLKCCLMSISLPWEHIVYDLLFKGDAPVNL